MGGNMSKEIKELEDKIDKLDYRFKRLFNVMYARRVPEESHEIEEHEEVDLELGAKKVKIDKKIASLVAEMNKLGLETTESCEGRDNPYEPAYIAIDLRCLERASVESGQLVLRWYSN
jgi:hypothetical protein